jgi:hypothetical protein
LPDRRERSRNALKRPPLGLDAERQLDQGRHDLEPGEQVTEEFRVAGGRGCVVWTVREREAPCRWSIEGKAQGGGSRTVTYALTPHNSGTIVEREFAYAMPSPLLALLGQLLLPRRVEGGPAEALRRLKKRRS